MIYIAPAYLQVPVDYVNGAIEVLKLKNEIGVVPGCFRRPSWLDYRSLPPELSAIQARDWLRIPGSRVQRVRRTTETEEEGGGLLWQKRRIIIEEVDFNRGWRNAEDYDGATEEEDYVDRRGWDEEDEGYKVEQ